MTADSKRLVYSCGDVYVCGLQVLEIRPPSLGAVPVGRRVCAYWSQQFSCLYPGLVVADTDQPPPAPPKPSSAAAASSAKQQRTVNVEFDDGDNLKIQLEHVRLLPRSFPIQSESRYSVSSQIVHTIKAK